MWTRGTVPAIWNDDYKKYKYIRQPISEAERLDWKRQGWYHHNVSGEMYDSRNPMPDYVEQLSTMLNLTNCGYVFYKMSGLIVMPPHIDKYEKYSEVFNVPYDNVIRALVFLEDWKPGHYFEIDNQGIVNWSAGDYILWGPGVIHAASNVGKDTRYTLQITGSYA